MLLDADGGLLPTGLNKLAILMMVLVIQISTERQKKLATTIQH